MAEKVEGRITMTDLIQFENLLSVSEQKEILMAISEMMQSREIYINDSDIRDEIRWQYNVSIYSNLLSSLMRMLKMEGKDGQ